MSWLLILFLGAGPSVQVEMPGEQACKSAAGIALRSAHFQGIDVVMWACVPLGDPDEPS